MIIRRISSAAGVLGLSIAAAAAQPAPAAPPPPPGTGGCFENLIGEGQSVVGLSVQYPEARVVTVRAWTMAIAGSTLKITHGGTTCSQAQAVSNAFPVKLAVTCVRAMKAGEVAAVSIELAPSQEGLIHAMASCGR